MTAPGVAARFVSFRSSPTRGVMVLSLDVPIEAGQQALDVLGMPTLGSSVHVGLARIGGPATPGAAAVAGTYEACRTVQGRNAMQLTIEVPAERWYTALKSLGVPTPQENIQVAIALLTEQPPPPPPAPARTPGQMAVQQAALRVKDPSFQKFMLKREFVPNMPAANELAATNAVRHRVGIESRKELATDPEKLRLWHELISEYERYQQGGG